MKTLFTKGPWQVKHSESKPAFNVIGTALGGKYKIARCPYVVTGNEKDIDDRLVKEAEANARLIASAPELLEALCSLQNSLVSLANATTTPRATSSRIYKIIVDDVNINKLIAKATGEKESNHVG